MGRHLPKKAREERDRKVVKLYREGLTLTVIAERFGFGCEGHVSSILRRCGVVQDRPKGKRNGH